MAANPRYAKAKLLRDFMIETDTMKMFTENENEGTIFFRTVYPMDNDRKQVVINVNDSVYLGLQTLLVQKVPVEKNAEVIELLNECNLELPTVKYVLTKDQCVVVSMFFPADVQQFNAALIMGVIVQVLKNVAEKHYAKIKTAIIGENTENTNVDMDK